MALRRVVNGELRAYIYWKKRWCHVYIMGSYDQTTLIGEPVRMLYFKLSKSSREILAAEKAKFHKKKPAGRPQKRSEGA